MLRVTAASREAMSVLGEGTRVGGDGTTFMHGEQRQGKRRLKTHDL